MRQLRICFVAIALSAFLAAAETPAIKISFTDPAYAGMPIWVTVERSDLRKLVYYPSSIDPSNFDCSSFEVQYKGQLLKPVISTIDRPLGGRVCLSRPPGALEGRLPLHVQYSLTEAGQYLVRYRYRPDRLRSLCLAPHPCGPGRPEIVEYSEWAPLVLNPTPPDRERWVADQIANVPNHSDVALVGEALPSLLASRDRSVLRVMLEEAYSKNAIVSEYASYTLHLFDPKIVSEELARATEEKGPNSNLDLAVAQLARAAKLAKGKPGSRRK